MTNMQIIVSEAIANGLYTEDEALAIIEEKGSLPLHTFATWKALGYSVKKSEHARITTKLWKYKKSKQLEEIQKTEGADVQEVQKQYYLCKSFLFTADQVEKVAK